MSKTSPIVIPVTVDTTGVDRGMNNVRNRLTRGGGRGTGGGFGTGGNNAYGVGTGGSGGGVLSAAVAAGVASNITGRQVGRQVGKTIARQQTEMERRLSENFGVRVQVKTEKVGNRNVTWIKRSAELADLRQRELADLFDLNERRRQSARQRSLRGRLSAFGRDMMGDTKMRQDFIKNMLGRAGIPEFAGARVAAGLGGVGGMLGLGAGAALLGGAAASRFQQAQYQRFTNFQAYEGTPYFGIARRAARGYDKSAGMSFYDKMLLREKEAGGMFSNIIEGIGGAFSTGAELVGAALGGGLSLNPGRAAQVSNIIFGNKTRIAN